MSMIEIHNDALKSTNVVYHEFLGHYKKESKIVYGFVEGRDDPSFYQRMDNFFPDQWKLQLYRPGNRDKVFEMHDTFDWKRFSTKRICFFVDRDLAEFLDNIGDVAENIFVTDDYSVENYIVNSETLEKILSEVMNVNLSGLEKEEIEKIHDIFNDNLIKFKEAMTPIMAQIILWKRKGCRLELDSIKPKDFFEFKNAYIFLKTQYETVDSRIEYIENCCNIKSDTPESISVVEKEFHEKDGAEKYIRGKFMLWFFYCCATTIHKSIPKISNKYKKPPKIILPWGPKNAITSIAPRIRMPDSLKNFIRNNYIEYIQEYESCISNT
ncbi:hypothetical protein MettiDRAFT_1954 [Methanolobus tindarius DSM 2278]|uniref:DUF4435 domain-containing protein n=1 Tax=Methanolobus tindarius DSM 2278 TaxID=1090322 RepID=W9DXP8_METTI|nr:DUF4435 domain-containing protein [Methanolobus tindarius]ETA68482.1 hypothetical protein MettiDRAFT_1954 [Methanolobus tindarius DSM 2278]